MIYVTLDCSSLEPATTASQQKEAPRETPPTISCEEDSERPTTMYHAHEIERSLTALVWRHPDTLPLVRQELDFELHITLPGYRKIIQAVRLAFRKISEAKTEEDQGVFGLIPRPSTRTKRLYLNR
jgi:hypothetical protein